MNSWGKKEEKKKKIEEGNDERKQTWEQNLMGECYPSTKNHIQNEIDNAEKVTWGVISTKPKQ